MTELLNKRVDELSSEYIIDVYDDYDEYLGYLQNDETESMWSYIDFDGDFVDYFDTLAEYLASMDLAENNLRYNNEKEKN